MRKRWIGLWLCLVLFATFFGQTPALGEATPEPVKMIVMTWDDGTGLELQRQLCDAFEALNPHVQIELQSVVQGYDEKLSILNASDKTPDVLLMWNTPQYVEAGIVADLTPFIERDNFDMSIYFDIIANWSKYNGKIYGLPQSFTPRCIYYNKKCFDEAGLDYPQEGWTWDEFAEIVEKLSNGKKGADARYGFVALSSQTYQLAGYIWTNGGTVVSPDGKTASGYVDSDAVVETIEWYKRIFDMSARSLIATGEGNPGNAEFMSGKVAMMDNGMWPLADLVTDPSIEFGLVSPPVPKAGMQFKTVVHSATWSMFEKSQNKDLAWEFIKFAGSPEGSKIMSGTNFAFTPIKSVVAELGQDQGLNKVFFDMMSHPTIVPEFTKSPYFFEADGEFGAACERVFLNNEDPRVALSEAAKAMDKILQQ